MNSLAGNGINCVTTARVAYLAGAPTAISAPSGTIHPARDPEWYEELFDHDDGAQWQTVDPNKGPRIGLVSGPPLFVNTTVNGASSGGAGARLYLSPINPTTADCQLDVNLKCFNPSDNLLANRFRYVDGNNFLEFSYNPATTTFSLDEVIAGIPNNLATAVHDLVPDGIPGHPFSITLAGANITVTDADNLFAGPFPTLHLSNGKIGAFFDGAASIGNAAIGPITCTN